MTPDPQTVREIAREHIRSGIADIGTTIVKHHGNGALSDEEYGDWYHAVLQAWRIELRAVSWPDEQQPGDVVTGEQQDGADAISALDEWDEIDQLRILLAGACARADRAEAERREDVAAARRERDEAKAETANLSACLMLMMARYGNQTFHEGDVKRAAELMAAMAPDAAQDGLSATETDGDGVQGSGVELEFGKGAAGLSEPCRSVRMSLGIRHHCHNDAPHAIHECGDCLCHWTDDDTTEDGQHG